MEGKVERAETVQPGENEA